MRMRRRVVVAAAAAALAVAPAPAHACSVPTFVTGKGLPYHTRLASHPANLLIYADPARPLAGRDDAALSNGLQAAGHTVTVVRAQEALKAALGQAHYDLVISAFGSNGEIAGQVTADAPGAVLLPVVERRQRKAPALRQRFDRYVVEGASLGTYLRAIDEKLAQHRP